MQKRARAVESQKLRRTMKGRTRGPDTVRDGMGAPLAYAKLACIWLSIVMVDALVGFRFEYLWPFWLIIRAGYEAVHKNSNQIVALNQPQSTKFSVFFVCVTATSDLICFLFIPVRILIFLASTYVWMHLVCNTHGGFLRTVSLVLDRTQAMPVVLLWSFFFLVELSFRFRCDYEVFTSVQGAPFHYFNLPNGGCSQISGLSPPVALTLNSFFGAHCIGYPVVVVLFSSRYYYKEWRIRRKQEDVARRNESYFKLLTEALPAIYDGPKDYSNADNESVDYDYAPSESLALGPPLPPAIASSSTVALSNNNNPPRKQSIKNGGPPTSKSSRGNARLRKSGTGASASSKLAESTTSTPETKSSRGGAGAADLDDSSSDASHVPSRGFVIVRLIAEALSWLTWALASPKPNGYTRSEEDDVEDEDEEENTENSDIDDEGDWRRKNRSTRTTLPTKSRGRGGRAAAKTDPHPPPPPVSANGSTRGARSSSAVASPPPPEKAANGDAPTSNGRVEKDENGDATTSRAQRALEAELRVQLSVWQNNEKAAKQEISLLRARCEQLETKLSNIQKSREGDRTQQQQLERKYAELLNRKNDIERDLMAERKARKEEANNRHRVATADALIEEHREKERAWEREAEALRAEIRAKDELIEATDRELAALRSYKEQNDIESLEMEVKIVREKNTHLEESLAAENRLKLDLFRALGEAKANNEQLQASLRARELDCRRLTASNLPLHANNNGDVEEKASPTGSSSSQGTASYAPMPQSQSHSPPPSLLTKSDTNGLLHMANSFQPYAFSAQEPRLFETDTMVLSEGLTGNRFGNSPSASLK